MEMYGKITATGQILHNISKRNRMLTAVTLITWLQVYAEISNTEEDVGWSLNMEGSRDVKQKEGNSRVSWRAPRVEPVSGGLPHAQTASPPQWTRWGGCCQDQWGSPCLLSGIRGLRGIGDRDFSAKMEQNWSENKAKRDLEQKTIYFWIIYNFPQPGEVQKS